MNNSNDFDFQFYYILNNAWRLMSAHDDDRASPSFGSAHYSYWRDKTSEFSDARFQEAGATLGLLCSHHFDNLDLKEFSLNRTDLYSFFSASLNYLSKIQYKDGSFDEWYKGERGFAATEFTTIAYSLAGFHLADRLKPSDRETLTLLLRKSTAWLKCRNDLVKSNHQAAAAAALSIVGKFLNDATLIQSAKLAADDVLERQTSESWFPEIGGMDLGYCSVLLDYLMIYQQFSGDDSVINPMMRLYKFMLRFTNPNLTIMKEFGLCLNPYVSRLGIGLLSKFSDEAANAIHHFSTSSPGIEGLKPYLADDLRFFRWSYLPLLVKIYEGEFKKIKGNFRDKLTVGWHLSQEAQAANYHRDDIDIFFAPCSGGTLQIFKGNQLIFKNIGIVLNIDETKWSSTGYSKKRNTIILDNRISLISHLMKSSFFFPGFISRTFLRIGCIHPWSSSLIRSIIDFIRVKSSSAINQSAAPIFKTNKTFWFEREILVEMNQVRINDYIYLNQSELENFNIDYDPNYPPLNIYVDIVKTRICIEYLINI